MYDDPRDLARAAVDLLKLSYQEGLPASTIASIELGAATMCNHVWDWHEHKYGPARYAEALESLTGQTQPRPDEKTLRADFRSEFSAAYPEWDILRQISNGIKHAKPLVTDAGSVIQRQVEWEDSDWWSASHGVETLFVSLDGRQLSVSATVVNFVSSYLGESV